jgi:uncharacterized protein (TIGR01777 family)
LRIAIAGGSGFIGKALTRALLSDGHQVWVLTRRPRAGLLPEGAQPLLWDGQNGASLGEAFSRIEAVVNLAGESLARWPWTAGQKRRFLQSRVGPGKALSEAIRMASPRPRVFLQISGINHYGLSGEPADESTPPAGDYLARLTVDWEAASQEVESLGVRRCVVRMAVVLGRGGGLLPLMALPVRLFLGGRLGSGRQAVPWVHIDDVVGAIRFLLENGSARGAFNLIAPQPVSNADFYCCLAKVLGRPYWFPTPAFLLRLALGEMSVLILDGRPAQPRRLLEAGYRFHFEELEAALREIYAS